MKNIIILLFCAFYVTAYAQTSPPKWSWRTATKVAVISGIGGVAHGANQMFHYHPWHAEKLFGNPNKWDPALTWTNKWKNGDEAQGERFLGSSTMLAFTTDASHATRFINHLALASTGFVIGFDTFQGWDRRTKKERRKVLMHALGYGAISYAARGTGFHSIYTIAPRIFN